MALESRIMTVNFHLENMPEISDTFRNIIISEFVSCREEFVKVFNVKIGEVNDIWDRTGKPATFGEYLEDINPEYIELIRKYFTDDLNRINKKHFIKCYISKYGDVEGNLPPFGDSRIYATLS